MQYSLLVDHELAPDGAGYIVRALVRFTGHVPAAPQGDGAPARIPINLSLVLDRSGSMTGEKLAAARDAAISLVRRLAHEDVVSVVAFDTDVLTIAMPATGDQQATLTQEIARIDSAGSTNLSGGWLRGRELVMSRFREGGVNRVLLLTDGQANVGITDPALLKGLCAGAAREGVTTSTIGFGADYDEVLLRGMADAGGGNTWYIERPDQAIGVFEEEIEGLLSLAAQNLAVAIHPGAAVKLIAVHNDYPFAELPDDVRRYELGDLYAREPKSMLVEFFVPGADARDAAPVAELVVHAHVLLPSGAVERQEIRCPIASPLSPAGNEEPEVRRELLMIAAARAREEALERQQRGDWGGASGVLAMAAADLASAPAAYALDEQVADLNATAAQMAAEAFDAADAKYTAQRAYNARRGKGLYEEKLSRGRGARGG